MLRTAVRRLGGVSLELLGWSKAGSEVRLVLLSGIPLVDDDDAQKVCVPSSILPLVGNTLQRHMFVLTRAPRVSHAPVGGFNGGEGRWRF